MKSTLVQLIESHFSLDPFCKTTNFYLVLPALFLSTFLSAQYQDSAYKTPVSIKFDNPLEIGEEGFQKVVVDYNGIAYLLNRQIGLYRLYEGSIVKDNFYLSLSDKTTIDICIQDESGYLYYLMDDGFLTNAHAGAIYASLKHNYDRILVSRDDEVMLFNTDSASVYHKRTLMTKLGMPNELIEVYSHLGLFFARAGRGIYILEEDKWELIYECPPEVVDVAFAKDHMVLARNDGFLAVDFLGNEYYGLDKKVPVSSIHKVVFHREKLWAISNQGAFSRDTSGLRYYASKRWLDSDTIIDLAIDFQGDVFFLTRKGLNQIDFRSMTLGEKADYFEEKIRKNHLRYGFVSALNHSRPGQPYVHDHDNDGLWTSFYLSSQALKHFVTGDDMARRYAWESFEAYERLLSVNPLDGFPSRTFERTGYKVSDPQRWRQNSPDPGWEWKGTTSSDEYVAYLLVAAMMDEFVAQSEDEHRRIAAFIDDILMHIIDNDYYFIDDDGQPTTWARWHPEFVNGYAKSVYDRKLNSTLLIAGFQLGWALTQKTIYLKELNKIIEEFGYLENMMIPMSEISRTRHEYDGHVLGLEWNHSDDEMAFLTYWVLHRFALNDSLRNTFSWVIEDHWKIEKPERNALWNLISLATCGSIDEASTMWHLQEFPLDLRDYAISNSHRQDLNYLPPNFRGETTANLLPPSEQPMHRHNRTPFILDSRGSHAQLAGDEYLFPYWLARYLGFVSDDIMKK